MGKYVMGVDFAKDEDYTAYTVMRRPRWYERLLRKLKLSKAVWEWKVIDSHLEPPVSLRKFDLSRTSSKAQSKSKGNKSNE